MVIIKNRVQLGSRYWARNISNMFEHLQMFGHCEHCKTLRISKFCQIFCIQYIHLGKSQISIIMKRLSSCEEKLNV